MTHAQAIIVSIALAVGSWFLVQSVQQPVEQPTPPAPPGPAPVTQPVPATDAVGNPIQLYRDVQKLVDNMGQMMLFAQRVEKAVGAAARELAQGRIRETVPQAEQPQRIVPQRWQPTERQVVLYFYDDVTLHAKAASLIRQGHHVYRAGPHRSDLYQQYDVRTTPVWLVIRDNVIIYRSHRAPRFIDVTPAPVRQAPTYQAPPVRYYNPPMYRGGFSCAGGGC